MQSLNKLKKESEERLVTTKIRDKDGIYDAIKAFLGKGK
jgi:hypothetical protein